MLSLSASRVGTFAQNSSFVQRMVTLQSQLRDTEVQLVTERKSQTYSGIATDSFRLVSVEADRSRAEGFIRSNTVAATRLSVMSTAATAVDDRARLMRSDLAEMTNSEFSFSHPLSDEDLDRIEDIQAYAFQAMQDIADYLNTKADGRYVFSGGAADNLPVNLPYGSLEEFQAAYNGTTLTYPISREANVSDISLSNEEHGGLDFTAAVPGTSLSTITATNAASLDGIEPGATIRLVDPNIGETTFTVTANDGAGTLTVSPAITAAQEAVLDANAASAKLEVVSYYGGDGLTVEHRVNDTRTIEFGVTAKDAGFEKALRALGILAQGGLDDATVTIPSGAMTNMDFNNANGTVTANGAAGDVFADIPVGTTVTFPGSGLNAEQTFLVTANDGGVLTLDPPPSNEVGATSDTVASNLGRITYAKNLLSDAITHEASNTRELSGDIEAIAQKIGFNEGTLDRAITEGKEYVTFLQIRETDLENINRTEVAANLQNQATALEVSYAAFSRVSGLSLLSFL